MLLTHLLAGLFLLQTPSTTPVYMQSTTTPEGIVEMRTSAQKLSAPGKPDVWLVAAIHIGSKQYYADLQTLLDAQGTVLFEGVKPSKDAPAPKKEETPKTPVYKVLSDSLGLEFQLTEIKYNRPGWVNSDLSMDDLDKLNKEKGGGKPTGFDTVKQLLDPNSPMAANLTNMLKVATPGLKEAIKLVIVKSVASGKTPGLDEATQDVILHARNKAVLDTFGKTISAANPPKSIAIFYGAMHMPDMEKELTAKYGYKPSEQKWFMAASADPKKMDAQGKALYDAFEKMSAPKKSGGGLLAAWLQ